MAGTGGRGGPAGAAAPGAGTPGEAATPGIARPRRVLGLLPLVPLAVVAGVPVLLLPVQGIAVVAAASALVAGIGAVARIRVVVAAGGALLLADYALALWAGQASPDPLGAAVVGVGLALALEIADFHARFHRAAVPAPVLRGQAVRWALGVAGGMIASTALAVLALVGLRMPAGIAPLLAAAGAIGAVAAAAAGLSRLTAPPPGGDNPGP